MKYINELREGENVIEHYLCKMRQSMKSRNGKTYLSLKLQDKTGKKRPNRSLSITGIWIFVTGLRIVPISIWAGNGTRVPEL